MNIGLINKPKGDGATKRVWEIASELTRQSGSIARRKNVIDAYVAEGGNANTASTQYYYWKAAQNAEPETSPAQSGDPLTCRLRIGTGGRVELPAEFLAALDLGKGDLVSVSVKDGELRMVSVDRAIRKVQGLLAKHKRPGESIVDEFLAERRAMWGEE